MKRKGRVGSSFDGASEGRRALRAGDGACHRSLAGCANEEEAPHQDHFGIAHETSRAQIDRVLDPNNESVTLATLTRAAHAVGRKLQMELVQADSGDGVTAPAPRR